MSYKRKYADVKISDNVLRTYKIKARGRYFIEMLQSNRGSYSVIWICTLKKQDFKLIHTADIRFIRPVAGYAVRDYKSNES